MAKDKLTDYSATNSLNTDVGGVNIDEGMLPSDVNNALREVMTHLKDFAEGTQAVNNIKFAGATTTGDINFGDNAKATFGDAVGGDLQIFHDAGNSRIVDAGTGNLNLQADNNINILDAAGTGFKAQFITGGAVNLFYANGKKFETTNTGIDVTGTVTADELTVDGDISLTGDITSSTTMDIGPNAFGAGVNLKRGNGAVNGLSLTSGGDVSFYDSLGTTQGLFWDASTQRLGLGTTAPSALLHLDGTTPSIYLQPSADTEVAAIRFRNAADNNTQGMIEYNHSENSMSFRTNGVSDRLFVDSSGNVGIGTTSPSNALEVYTTSVLGGITVSGPNAPGLTFNDTTDAAYCQINTQNAGDLRFYADKSNVGASTTMEFHIDGSEAMRIDSSGNLLVGKTAYGSVSTDGTAILPSVFQTSASNDRPMLVNRNGTDGNLIEFSKAGAAVGSIGTQASALFIGTADEGVKFVNDGIAPWNPSTNGARDNAIDIGFSGNRFKDLYLSGGVYLGGTGSANYLDDYEEGTWTPVGATSSGTAATFGSVVGTYVKIGNLVTVNGEVRDVDTTGTTSASQFRISGLPFTPTSAQYQGSASTNSVAFQGTATSLTSLLSQTSGTILFYVTGDGIGRSAVDHGDITSGTSDFFFTIQYQTF